MAAATGAGKAASNACPEPERSEWFRVRREPLWAAPSPTGRCSAPARSARPRQTSGRCPARHSTLLFAERRPPSHRRTNMIDRPDVRAILQTLRRAIGPITSVRHQHLEDWAADDVRLTVKGPADPGREATRR